MTVLPSRFATRFVPALVILSLNAIGCDDSNDGPGDAAADGPVPYLDANGRETGPRDGGSDLTPNGPTDGATSDVVASIEPDINMVLVRLDKSGNRDLAFGNMAGTAVLNLSARSGDIYDSPYGIAGDAQGRLVIFGRIKGSDKNTAGGDKRTDGDRVVVRLTKDGLLDTSFATQGVHTLNIAGLNDIARHGFVQANGDIVASGYTKLPTLVGTQEANAIVLLRLKDDGSPDPLFGVKGVVTSNPFRSEDPLSPWGYAEAYSIANQNGKYVTTGYGQNAAPLASVDVVSVRYDEKGALDKSFGTQGVHTLNLADQADQGRDLRILPDGRVMIVGNAAPVKDAVDAMVVVLLKDGTLDPSFNGVGHQLWDFAGRKDFFRSVDVSRDGKWAAAAGYSTGGAQKDDSIIGLIPLTAAGNAVVKLEPISVTAADRYVSVAFAPDGTFYAAGFVAEGDTDTAMVVARFKADGTKDTTFGLGGVTKVNVAVGKGTVETATSLFVQADGSVVVAGAAEAM